MSKTKWYTRPIYLLVALALVLSLGIVAVPMAGVVGANGVSEVWVDDDTCPATGSGTEADPYCKIQDGIDAVAPGGTVHVADGTYNENIVVNKSLTLKAASSPIIDGLGTMWVPAVEISAADVTLQGFTIQNFKADATHDLAAVFVHGDSATIMDNTIKDICSTTTVPYGIGIDVTANNVVVTGNTVHDVDSIGIRVRHDWATPPTTSNNILIENNEVYHTGNSGVLITGYAKGVTIKGNEIYESLTTGTAYGVLLCMNPSYVTIENNYIHDSYANIVIAGAHHITISGNDIGPATNDPYPGKNIYVLNDYNAWTGTIDTLSTEIDIVNNSIHDGAYGVRIRNINATVDPAPMATTTTINCNNIVGNTEYGVQNQIATDVDAENNWWGHASGPCHSTNPLGIGDAVSDNVDYEPWSFTPDPCEPKSKGFWKNHQDSVDKLLAEYGPVFLGAYEVADFVDAEPVFSNERAKCAEDMLAPQLLAAELNVLHLTHLGIDTSCVAGTIVSADAALVGYDAELGRCSIGIKGKDKEPILAIADVLDSFNNGEMCGCLCDWD